MKLMQKEHENEVSNYSAYKHHWNGLIVLYILCPSLEKRVQVVCFQIARYRVAYHLTKTFKILCFIFIIIMLGAYDDVLQKIQKVSLVNVSDPLSHRLQTLQHFLCWQSPLATSKCPQINLFRNRASPRNFKAWNVMWQMGFLED
jgi:hypothetical protein